MTAPLLKVKAFQRAVVKTKADIRLPAKVTGGAGIAVKKANGEYTFDLDHLEFVELAQFTPANEYVVLVNAAGEYKRVSLASLFNNSQTTVRVVTEAGNITVGPNVQLLVMNRTANESPSNIILPLASAKVGKIKIVDFKGNAGTYPHTIGLQGSDTFQGGLTSWTLGADGASVVFDPIPGVGYAA